MSPGWPTLSTDWRRMTSMVSSCRALAVGGRRRTRKPPPIRPGIAEPEAEREGGEQRWSEDRHGHDGRRAEPAGHEPEQYTGSAQREQRPEEYEEIDASTVQDRQARDDENGDGNDQPPDELVVEPELTQSSQRFANACPAEPVIERPGQRQRDERLQREQRRKGARSKAGQCREHLLVLLRHGLELNSGQALDALPPLRRLLLDARAHRHDCPVTAGVELCLNDIADTATREETGSDEHH